MADCIKCGAYIEPGKGKPADGLFAKGFICDNCSRENAKSAVGCILSVLVLIFGALTAFVSAYALRPIAESSGYDTARNIFLAMDAMAWIIWFICHHLKRRASGFIVRMTARLVGFLALCFAVGSSLSAFLNDGDLLRNIWQAEASSTSNN